MPQALDSAYDELSKYHFRSDVHPKEALRRAIAVYLNSATIDDHIVDKVATAINCMKEHNTSNHLGFVLCSTNAVVGLTPEDTMRDLRRLCRDIAIAAISSLESY